MCWILVQTMSSMTKDWCESRFDVLRKIKDGIRRSVFSLRDRTYLKIHKMAGSSTNDDFMPFESPRVQLHFNLPR